MRAFMDDPPEPEEGVESICRLLRTKTAFGTTSGYTPWRTGESRTAAFWCLGTMGSVGPDEALAHPHRCREGRACWRSPEA